MAAVALVCCRHDLGAALLPHLEDAVDRGGRQIRAVAQHDNRSFGFVSESLQPAPERGAAPALPLGAVDGSRRARHVVRSEHDNDVSDRALPHSLEHWLEEDRLLDVAEARRGARGEDDRGG